MFFSFSAFLFLLLGNLNYVILHFFAGRSFFFFISISQDLEWGFLLCLFYIFVLVTDSTIPEVSDIIQKLISKSSCSCQIYLWALRKYIKLCIGWYNVGYSQTPQIRHAQNEPHLTPCETQTVAPPVFLILGNGIFTCLVLHPRLFPLLHTLYFQTNTKILDTSLDSFQLFLFIKGHYRSLSLYRFLLSLSWIVVITSFLKVYLYSLITWFSSDLFPTIQSGPLIMHI